jgi:hypothetical protein
LQDAHPVTSHVDPTSRLPAVTNSDLVQSVVIFPFLNMIGSCQFAGITTCSDIAYAMNVVATSKHVKDYQPLLNAMLLKGLAVL